MGDAEKAETIRRCFQAYNTQDRAAIERMIAPDFRFTSPYDHAIDRATYFARCWPNAGRIARHEIERIFVEGDAAFATYLAVTHDGAAFRNTEFFTFAGAQIASVDVYFGAAYKDGAFVTKT
jgi:ketosteroid isomerase-like protein